MQRTPRCSVALVLLAGVAGCDSSAPKAAAPTTTVQAAGSTLPATAPPTQSTSTRPPPPTVVPPTLPPSTVPPLTAPPPTVPQSTGPVSSGPPGRRFTVSSSHLEVGKAVTFSGTGCAHKNVATVYISGVGTVGTQASTYPRTDRTWSRTVMVGDPTLLGVQSVRASCQPRSRVRPLFDYAPVDVEVTTFRRLVVAPGTTIRAGTTLDVTAIGACPAPPISHGAAALALPRGTSGTFPGVYGTTTQDAQGNWTARVAIPGDTPSGAYDLTGDCVYSRSMSAWYPTAPITVLPKS